MKRPRPLIVRKNGRIYFGEGANEWSVWDPGYSTSDARHGQRAADWTWLINVCPTTADVIAKVRLIRWAVRNIKVTEATCPS